MNESDITSLGAARLSELVHDRHLSCREVMAAFLDRIDTHNSELNAIVSRRDRDVLMDEAGECDDELVSGFSRGWMHGLPQAVKDLSETRGLVTTMGSPLFRDYVPEHDGLMVARMRDSGCLFVGKTNAPEFGMGSHTFNEVFGATRNAYDPTRSAGGSSGGAAVALATRMLPGRGRQRLHGLAAQPGGMEQRVRLAAQPRPGTKPPGARQVSVAIGHRGADGPFCSRRRDAARHAGGLRPSRAAVARRVA